MHIDASPQPVDLENVADLYQQRTQRLKNLGLQEVILQTDASWLIESVGRKSAPKFLETLMEKYLKREDKKWWEAVQAEPDIKLVNLLRDEALKTYKIEYDTVWAATHNRLCREFITSFCDEAGNVQWETLVKFNSGSR